MKKEAIGLSIEGTDVKVAHIAFAHKGVILKRLEVAQLPGPLGVASKEDEPEAGSLDAFEEAFGDSSQVSARLDQKAEEVRQRGEGESASSTLLGVLSGYNLTKAKIGVNLPEDAVSFYALSDTFAIKGHKLKKALIDMVSPKHDGAITPEMVDYIKAADNNLACLVCEHEPVFLEVLKELRPFLGQNKPYVGLIDSADTALMGLVRANHELVDGEITAIIYICADSTRIIVMKGREYVRVLPSIQEGANSQELSNTIFSKILFEQDEGGLPDVNHVILAGEADMPSMLGFFSEKMPEARVEIIKYGKFAGTEMEPSKIPAPLASFALALALAKKTLDPTNADYYKTDFTPDYLKEAQKPFKIAWHGLLALLVIFSMSLLLVIKGGYNYAEKQDLREDTFNHNRLTRLAQPLLYEIDMLNEKIALFQAEMAQLASLAQDSHIWSESLQKLCDLTERCDSMWITSLASSEEIGYVLKGKSRARENITALVSAYQNSYLDSVSRGKIRDYGLWDFVMRVKFPDVLQPQVYIARVKEHSRDGFGQDAHAGLSEPGLLAASASDLNMSVQGLAGMPGGENPLMASSTSPSDMRGQGMVGGLLRAGFNAYYEQAQRIADSPELKSLRAEEKRHEAEQQRIWMEQKRAQEERNIAATEKPLEELYRGPKVKSSQDEPAPEPTLKPAADPEATVKTEGGGQETQDATTNDEQADRAAELLTVAEGGGAATDDEGPQLAVGSNPQYTSAASQTDRDRALAMFKAGEYEQAIELFNGSIAAKHDPKNDCSTHYWLGHCFYGMADFEAAIAEFDLANSCGDEGIEDGVLFMLGNCHLRLGDQQAANEEYSRLLKNYPNSRYGPIASARTGAERKP
ncbi:MAG: tetratricopeptide repeat protein [Candidatus Coatesbacteria bacterium]|nr:tetratricopeptide repeat protein [Candidatus Coatesbacteria bacterium]